MTAEIDRLRLELKRSTEGGGAKYVERHKARGKLLPRERVEALLDHGSYFLEIAPLAGIGMDGEVPGAGLVGGIGLVEDRECLIIANEATAKGGATGEPGLLKNARLGDIARENRLPVILLVEAAGADLPQQSKVFVPGGRGFREITRRSRMRIPTISVVFGPSTAGGAYLPGMSDYVIMVRKRASVYLAGPPLVKMATGEIADEESLGGAEMHSRVSGLSDYLAESEMDGIRIAREIVSHFNLPKPRVELAPVEEPAYPRDELLSIPAIVRPTRTIRSARGHRKNRGRLAIFGIQSWVRNHARHRFRAGAWDGGRGLGEQRGVDVGIGGQRSAIHRSGKSAEHSANLLAEHHWIYGGAVL